MRPGQAIPGEGVGGGWVGGGNCLVTPAVHRLSCTLSCSVARAQTATHSRWEVVWERNGGSPGRADPRCRSQSGSRWAGTRHSTGHGLGPAAGTGTFGAGAAREKPTAIVWGERGWWFLSTLCGASFPRAPSSGVSGTGHRGCGTPMTQILKGAMILSTKTSRIRDPRRPGGPPQAGKLALGVLPP